MTAPKKKPTQAPAFTKEQWLESEAFPEKDVLSVALENGKAYKEEEVRKRVRDFMKVRY